MSATFSPSYGWKVTRCDPRIAQRVNDDDIAQDEEVGDKGDVNINTGEELNNQRVGIILRRREIPMGQMLMGQ